MTIVRSIAHAKSRLPLSYIFTPHTDTVHPRVSHVLLVIYILLGHHVSTALIIEWASVFRTRLHLVPSTLAMLLYIRSSIVATSHAWPAPATTGWRYRRLAPTHVLVTPEGATSLGSLTLHMLAPSVIAIAWSLVIVLPHSTPSTASITASAPAASITASAPAASLATSLATSTGSKITPVAISALNLALGDLRIESFLIINGLLIKIFRKCLGWKNYPFVSEFALVPIPSPAAGFILDRFLADFNLRPIDIPVIVHIAKDTTSDLVPINEFNLFLLKKNIYVQDRRCAILTLLSDS